MSRPTYYQAETAFAQSGLAGLLPKPRGPKGGHRLTATIMAFIEQRLRQGEPMHARTLADALKSELGVAVHPRSIERAIARKKKPLAPASHATLPVTAVEVYESLRAAVVGGRPRGPGAAALRTG